jgi:PAS domain S-box-containing protein
MGEADPTDSSGLEVLFNLSPDLLCLATVDGYFKRVNPAFQRTLGYTTEELVTRPFLVFVHPDDVLRTHAALEVLAGGGELHEFENRYVSRDGSVRWLQWNCRPGPTQGLVAAAARDVTDNVARQEQAALRRVATVVAHGAAPNDVFKAVADEVACLLDSDLTFIGRYEPDATFSYLASGGPMPQPELVDRPTIGGNNLVSNIRRSGHPEAITYDAASGPIGEFAHTLGIRSGVGTPILVDGRIWGAMLAGWTEPHEIPCETVDRLAEITELVGTAIANAQSRTALVESRARVVAAGDDTRRRIGRDLHDGAQQRLVTLALNLRSHPSAAPPELAELFADVARGLEEILDELRELARGIHPAVLSEFGLGPALDGLARRAPIPVNVDVQVPARLPERIEVAVYYIVAEALTNVAKHAQASNVVVAVEASDGVVSVSVSDDGVGGADTSRGSGLLGLLDRVDSLGGTMLLTSPSGGGTTLVVELPLTC